MSPWRNCRIPANVEEVAPCPTSAMSPPATIVNDPPGLTAGRLNAPAIGTASAATTTISAILTAANYRGNPGKRANGVFAGQIC